jgi:hypothetical protein
MISDSSTSALEPLSSSNVFYVIRHSRYFCNFFCNFFRALTNIPCIRISAQRSSTFSFMRGNFSVAIVTFGLQWNVGI